MAAEFDHNAANAAMARWAAFNQGLQQSGSGTSPLLFLMGLGHGRVEVDAGQSLSCQGKGLNGNRTAKFRNDPMPGPLGKLIASLGLKGPEILEGFKKCKVDVREASIGDITGKSHGLGSPSTGSDHGIAH